MENTVNIDVIVRYQWHNYLNDSDANIVIKAIEEGDFNTFKKIVQKYPFFPNTATLIYQDNYIGQIDIMNPIGFSLITENCVE